MIHSVYIIYQINGICVKYRRYGTIEFNEDLLAGFLTALKDFSMEVTGGTGEIKVLDMQTYVVLLVFQEGFLVAAAADKQDDRILGQNALQKVLDEFIARYSDVFVKWEGNLNVFTDFDEVIDEIMQNGLIAKVPREMPILEIYWKDYQKFEANKMKGREVTEKEFEKFSAKRLPRQVVTQGYLSEKEYEVAHLCNGYNDADDISQKGGITMDALKTILDKLRNMGTLKAITIE
ncbi:MAG TPA: hypothetical protein VKK79_19835 [Candidatus Lokiarchaeia archaeon]|nr:hypothetical protein [Candidatus Lokiarchaeia archaeon]